MAEGFYSRIPAFRDFDGVLAEQNYARVPSDASVYVTDVRGSTKAIEAGRYKDVNVLGVASILAARNAVSQELAYVFGGDGASIVVEAGDCDAVSAALARLRKLGRDQLGLELRVGRVPVSTLDSMDARVEVARFETSPNVRFAMFRGGGLALADRLVKDPSSSDRYEVPEAYDADTTVVDGLECRWNPLPTQHGVVVSLLVQSLAGSAPYAELLATIDRLAGSAARPVSVGNLVLSDRIESMRAEALMRGGAEGTLAFHLHRIKAYLLTFLGRMLLRTGASLAGFDGSRYRDDVVAQSDTRKFDDCLRMVLDLSVEAADQLDAYLAEQHAAGKLVYGTHRSSAALMTCIVKSHAGDHVHFVDGADGGYAFAARSMKRRLRDRPTVPPT